MFNMPGEKHSCSSPDDARESLTTIKTSRSSASSQADEESYGLLGHGSRAQDERDGSRWPCLVILSIANVVLFAISLCLFSTWFYQTHLRMNAQLRRISSHTPILDRLELGMEFKKINGTLYPPKHQSPARARPNNASDEIWTEWEWARIIPVTADEVHKMAENTSTMVKLENEEWGLGDDAYAATLDVFHQLHCVNMLRRNIFKDYYGQHPPKIDLNAPETMFEIHMSHCLDILMQTVQCSGNLYLNTWHWVADEPLPFPDMSINRQCFDLDQLTDWRRENSVDLDKALKMKRPEGVKSLPGPDGYYKLLNITNPNHLNEANPDEVFNL